MPGTVEAVGRVNGSLNVPEAACSAGITPAASIDFLPTGTPLFAWMRRMKKSDPELLACAPHPLNPKGFNQKADIPCGCTIKHISRAMSDFLDFLGFVNLQLHS